MPANSAGFSISTGFESLQMKAQNKNNLFDTSTQAKARTYCANRQQHDAYGAFRPKTHLTGSVCAYWAVSVEVLGKRKYATHAILGTMQNIGVINTYMANSVMPSECMTVGKLGNEWHVVSFCCFG